MKIIVILVIALFVVEGFAQKKQKTLLGVGPEDSALYKNKKVFTCKDGSKTISAIFVNDDFCDCKDGSDEPGTSACPNGRFYCTNQGYRGEYIFSSRVNDGICDCCDGSDEYEGRAHCTNVCAAKGEELRKGLAQQSQVIAEGLKVKARYTEEGSRALGEKRAEQSNINAELAELKAKIAELEVEKEKQTKLEELEKHMRRAQLKAELGETAPATEAAQPEATESAGTPAESSSRRDRLRKAREALIHGKDKESEDEEEEYVEENETDIPPPTDEEIAAEESKTTEDAVEVEKSEAEIAIDNYKRPGLVASLTAPFTRAFARLQTAYYSIMHKFHGKFNPSEAQKVRDEFEEAKAKQRDLEKKARDLESELKHDYGTNGEFYPLRDKCFSLDTNEYTYEVCFFGRAAQKPKNGGGSTNLGTFSEWKDRTYKAMKFTGGQSCWQGPQRSIEVSLKCGEKEEVKSIDEPGRCIYTAVMTSPAACQESDLQAVQV